MVKQLANSNRVLKSQSTKLTMFMLELPLDSRISKVIVWRTEPINY